MVIVSYNQSVCQSTRPKSMVRSNCVGPLCGLHLQSKVNQRRLEVVQADPVEYKYSLLVLLSFTS